MPLYVYETIRDDGQPGERFELRQGIREKPYTHHPETGVPIKRAIVAPFVAGSHSTLAIERKLQDNKKLGDMGFTKYEKQCDGTYAKTAGNGPDLIRRDNV